jgi:hypothetical protein
MINVDRVYQRVLTLANKEQRGYITPQEFNIFANHAQMDIFEQYFYDLNQFKRMPGNDTHYADMVSYLEEKISEHERIAGAAEINTIWVGQGNTPNRILPDFVYKINRVEVDNYTCEKQNSNDLNRSTLSPLTSPTWERPVYSVLAARNNTPQIERVLRIFDGINPTGNVNNNPFTNQGGIAGQGVGTVPRRVDPNVRNVGIFYIQRPRQVNWTYVVVQGKALYNATAEDAQDFDIHASEEQELVLKILSLAGVTLKDTELYQVAASEDTKNIQQEKQ